MIGDLLKNSKAIDFKRFLFIIFAIISVWFFVPTPLGLSPHAWHMLIIFIASMLGIMLGVANGCFILFMALLLANLSNTIDIKQGLSGFTNTVPWLLFFVLSIAKSITKSTIGLRVAYIFTRFFGKGILGLAYSIVVTEFFVAPILPSNTARCASVGLPIVSSLSRHISSNINGVSEKSVGAYLSLVYAYSNAICSGMFLTAMISNAVIFEAAQKVGVDLTWFTWAKYTIIPGVIILALIPIILLFFCNPRVKKLGNMREVARENYDSLGPLSSKERATIYTFLLLLFMWIFSDKIGVSVITTAILGLCIFLALGIVEIKEILSNHHTFEAVFLIGILISFVNCLVDFGTVNWFSGLIADVVPSTNGAVAMCAVAAAYFFSHYFFSGEGAMIIALYLPFLTTGLAIGAPKMGMVMSLAAFGAFSDVLAHYTCPVGMTMYSLGYVSAGKWMSVGIVFALIIMSVWFMALSFMN